MGTEEDIELGPLARKLLEQGSARWLDCSLSELAQQCEARRVREVFVALEGACHASCLREALVDDFFSSWVDQTCTIAEIWSVIHQLRSWLGLVDPWELGIDDVARLVDLSALPQSRKELSEWARVHGVEDALGHSMSVVAAETIPDAQAMSVLEAAAGVRHLQSQAEQYLQQRARAYLRAQAAVAHASRARDRLWQRTTSRVPVNLLASRLRALIAPFERSTLDNERFHKRHKVSLDANSGVCEALLRSQKIVEVTLQLDGFEDSALLGACESCQPGACVHQAALAARMLDACLDSQDRLHTVILEFTRVPSWQRLLTRLTQPYEGNGSLRYMVEWKDEQVYVGVLEQAAGVQLVAARKAQRRKGLSTQDRLALTAIARCAKTLGPERVRVDLAALRTLQGRRCVQSEADSRELQLREERLMLRFDEGMTPVLTLAGKQLGVPGPNEYLLEYSAERRTLAFAALTPEAQRALAALLSYRGGLPKDSLAALASWAAKARASVDVELPATMPSCEQATPRKLLFRVEPLAAGGVITSLGVQPFPLSPYWPPGEGEEVVYALQEGVLVHTRRDFAHERALAQRIVEQLELQQEGSWQFPLVEEQRALRVLSEAARLVDDIDLEWVDHKRRKLGGPRKLRASDLVITFLIEGDWLKLRGTALVDTMQVGLEQLLKLARRGLRYIRIEGGDYLEIEATLFAQLEQAEWTAHLTRDEIRIILAAAKSWLEQFGDRITADDPATAAWLADLRAGTKAATTHALPLGTQLRPYQADGARWLMRCSDWAPGACLADEMGLGKTIQAISVLMQRMQRGPALIVAPTSLITNWLSEIARFAPTLRTQMYHGPARKHCDLEPGTVTVTSYDIVLRDDHQLAQTHFATLVLDEAQVIRNPETKRAKALRRLRADFRIALTGTPIENRIGDLWSIFQVIAPGLLGPRRSFRPLLAVPVDRYRNARRAQLLRNILDPLLLRRTKRQVAPELPARIEIVRDVELSKPERAVYTAALTMTHRAFRGKPEERAEERRKRIVHILADLTMLRQLACHPRLVIPDSRIESSKLTTLLALLDDLLPQGHRVLVFSHFTAHLMLAREALERHAIRCLYLDGAVPALERKQIVDNFQRGDADVFLISLKAGGTGLNLTQADYVVHLDPWWNPAAEDQASDRAHRIGQTRPVTIIKLVAKDTIEENVLRLHEHKRWIAQSVLSPEVIGDDRGQLEELEVLLRHGPQVS